MRASILTLAVWTLWLAGNGLCISLMRVSRKAEKDPASMFQRLRLTHGLTAEWMAAFCGCAVAVEFLSGYWLPDALMMAAGTAGFFAHKFCILSSRFSIPPLRIVGMTSFYVAIFFLGVRTLFSV